MARITLRDVEVIFRDGTTPTPNELSIQVGDGNITWTEQRPLEYINDRDKIDDRRLASEVPLEVNLTIKWEYYGGTTGNPTPIDVLKFKNDAAAWLSTDPDPCRPKCIDLVLKNAPSCTGTDKKETYVFPKFFAENFDFDVQAGTLSVRGTCLATEVVTVREDITTAA